jgi:hypothetical protein
VDSVVVHPLLNGVLGNVRGVNGLGPVHVIAELPVVDFLGVAKITISTGDEGEVNWVRGHQAERFQNADELVRSHMLALCTVKVVEAWLEEDSLGDNLVVEALHYLNEAFEICSAHEGSRLCFFHGTGRIGKVGENVVQILAELGVTDETDFSRVGVLSEELLSFNLVKSHVKGTDASAELTEKIRKSFALYLQQPLHSSPCGACRSRGKIL